MGQQRMGPVGVAEVEAAGGGFGVAVWGFMELLPEGDTRLDWRVTPGPGDWIGTRGLAAVPHLDWRRCPT